MTSKTEFTPEQIQAFVTDTLDAGIYAQIEAAAKADPELAAELAIWRSARKVQSDRVAEAGASEFGWARIEKAINVSQDQRSANDNDTKPFWSRALIAPWQAAAAVALAIVGWQVAVVPVVATAGLDDEATYVLAGGETGQEFAFRVAFTDNANAPDIAAILRDVDARIIDGPSAIGFYTIAFDDPEAMEAARQTLSNDGNGVIAEVTDL